MLQRCVLTSVLWLLLGGDLSFLKEEKKKEREKWDSLTKERWLRKSVTLKGNPELAEEQGMLPITWLPVPAGMDSGIPPSHPCIPSCSAPVLVAVVPADPMPDVIASD